MGTTGGSVSISTPIGWHTRIYWTGSTASQRGLVFLYLVGDADVGGPTSRAEWQAEIHTVHAGLGLPALPAFVMDVFIDVRKFGSVW